MSFALNAQQKQAARIINGPVSIIAGPGTGKTSTLLARISYLIESGINPKDICVLTFTNKAAQEVTNRLSLQNDRSPWVGTFHSLAQLLIENESKNQKIASDQERKEIVSKVNKSDLDSDLTTKEILLHLSKYKQTSILKKMDNVIFESILRKYNTQLKKNGMIDYDDLLIKAFQKLNQDKKKRFRYILVDEFQDTNPLQYALLKLLIGKEDNIFVIGDPLQSIYSFQGALPKIFDDFYVDFPAAKKITLKINYRSSKKIVAVSGSLFPKNQTPKAYSKNSGCVAIIHTLNEFSEAEWIVHKINEIIGGSDLNKAGELSHKQIDGVGFRDFAILYRTHFLSQKLEGIFSESGIPFQKVGGNSLYEQREIRWILASLHYVSNKDQQLLDTFRKDIHIDNLKKMLDEIEQSNITSIVNSVVSYLHIEKILNTKQKKLRNLQHFRSLIVQYDKDPDGINNFMKYIDDLKIHDYYDKNSESVTFSTMHASKGLEFKYVFISGFEEGIIPFIRKQQTSIGEEKRLLYVAITRAKNELYFLKCCERGRDKKRKSSPFLHKLHTSDYELIRDKNIDRIMARRKRMKQKKSQMKLF